MYHLEFSNLAEKHLKRIDRRFQKLIAHALSRLMYDPKLGYPLNGKFKGLFKLRVSHYRIIYQVIKRRLVIFIVNIEHRKDIYR